MDLSIPTHWSGDKPFYVLIINKSQPTIIDLDVKDWAQIPKIKRLLRAEATWHLIAKNGNAIVFTMVVRKGEQPYYTERHFRRTTLALVEDQQVDQPRADAFGIGKKRLDGHTDRMWVFTDGQVCMGDDVDILGNAKLAR